MKVLAAFFVFLSGLWGGPILAQTQSVHFTATVIQIFSQTGNGLAVASSLGVQWSQSLRLTGNLR
jgi:hypothetical protein